MRSAPQGQATTEYLLVAAVFLVFWIVLEQSPSGLIKALIQALRDYGFSLSLPW
jgi:uncharacterized membrane protein